MKAISRFTLLTIAFALLTLPGNMGDVLVCLGEAGHVAVVSAGEQGCHSAETRPESAGHDDCIDVTVVVGDATHRTAKGDNPAQAILPATLDVARWTGHVTCTIAAPYRGPDWVATSPLVHRRTIVLLT